MDASPARDAKLTSIHQELGPDRINREGSPRWPPGATVKDDWQVLSPPVADSVSCSSATRMEEVEHEPFEASSL